MDLDEPVTVIINVPIEIVTGVPQWVSGVPCPDACPTCGERVSSRITADDDADLVLAFMCMRLHLIPAWGPASIHGAAAADAVRRHEEALTRGPR